MFWIHSVCRFMAMTKKTLVGMISLFSICFHILSFDVLNKEFLNRAALIWQKKSLIIFFTWLLLIFFICAFQVVFKNSSLRRTFPYMINKWREKHKTNVFCNWLFKLSAIQLVKKPTDQFHVTLSLLW